MCPLSILPGIVPVIGETEAAAFELEAELERLIKPEYARLQLAQTLKVKPEQLELDAELPAELPDADQVEGAKSRYTLIVTLARRERLTVRQLIGRLGGGRGHRTFAGTAEQVVQRRGLFRTEYEGTTLREHYGLARPNNQHAARRLDGAA